MVECELTDRIDKRPVELIAVGKIVGASSVELRAREVYWRRVINTMRGRARGQRASVARVHTHTPKLTRALTGAQARQRALNHARTGN